MIPLGLRFTVITILFGVMSLSTAAADGSLSDDVLLDEVAVWTTTNPGLKVRLSQQGLNYVSSVAVDILSSRVRQITIPPYHGSKDHIDYDITNTRVTDFVKPATSLVVRSGAGLTWSLTNLGISLAGDWRLKSKLFRDSGTFDGRISGASLSVLVTLGATPGGDPTITETGCSCSIADVYFKMHGGGSFIYKLFRDKIQGMIRNYLQQEICQQAHNVIVNASSELSSFKVKVNVGPQLVLDYGLVASPVFGAGFMETLHRGEFFFVGDTSEAPFKPSPLPSMTSVGRMVTFWISDYVLNTAGYVMHQHGALHHTITKRDLPDSSKDLLNLTCCPKCACLGKVLPPAGDLYPNSTAEIELSTTAPPTVVFGTSNITVSLIGNATLRARLINGSLAYLMKLKVEASSAMIPSFDGSALRLSVPLMTTRITIIDTVVHPVSELALNFIVNDVAIQLYVIPRLNEAGARGIPVPRVDHVQFINAGLELHQNAIIVSTDVKYIGQQHDDNTIYYEPVDFINRQHL